MFIERLINFFNGYVEFTASGGFPERFINLCSANGIYIYNVIIKNETISGFTNIHGFLSIRPYAKKAGMRVKLGNKHGFPFFLHRQRKRKGLLIGAAIFFAVILFLSDKIWTIKVKGNETIASEEIIDAFEELGIKAGMKASQINASETAAKALKKIDGIIWTAVNVDGCNVTIEIKERVKPPILDYDETPSNIIASNSGQIIILEKFKGTAVTEIGSAVEKGDVIISGAVINKDLSVSFKRAEGYIVARTKNTIECNENKICKMRVYNKSVCKIRINFFGLNFPILSFNPKGNYSVATEKDYLGVNHKEMPVGADKIRYSCYETKNCRRSEEMMRLICTEKYFEKYDMLSDAAEIIDRQLSFNCEKEKYSINGAFLCKESIGKEEKMKLKIENSENKAQ